MSLVTRGRLIVITVIAYTLAIEIAGTLISLGWRSGPNLDATLQHHFGISAREPSSPVFVAVDLLIVLALCWALYAGYPLARWSLALLYAGGLALLAWVVASVGFSLLSESGWLVLILAAQAICLLGLVAPSTAAFQRCQRGAVPSRPAA